jgi:hypothetical protein
MHEVPLEDRLVFPLAAVGTAMIFRRSGVGSCSLGQRPGGLGFGLYLSGIVAGIDFC